MGTCVNVGYVLACELRELGFDVSLYRADAYRVPVDEDIVIEAPALPDWYVHDRILERAAHLTW